MNTCDSYIVCMNIGRKRKYLATAYLFKDMAFIATCICDCVYALLFNLSTTGRDVCLRSPAVQDTDTPAFLQGHNMVSFLCVRHL